MSLYVDDEGVALQFSFTMTSINGTNVVSVQVKVVAESESVWDLSPSSTSTTNVTCQRVLVSGDLPIASRQGYTMRAWFYGAGNTLLGTSEEFRGPPVYQRHTS